MKDRTQVFENLIVEFIQFMKKSQIIDTFIKSKMKKTAPKHIIAKLFNSKVKKTGRGKKKSAKKSAWESEMFWNVYPSNAETCMGSSSMVVLLNVSI